MVKLWDLRHRSVLDSYLGHTDEINDMDIFARGRPLTGSTDKSARFWKTQQESHLVFGPHLGSVDAVYALTQDLYLTGGSDGALRVWHSQCGKPVGMRERAHPGLAAARNEHTAHLENFVRKKRADLQEDWEKERRSRELQETGTGNDAEPRWISAISGVRNSDLVVSGSNDGQLRTWRLGGLMEGSGQGSSKKRAHKAQKYTLEPLQEIPLHASVNQIAESKSFFACAIGREHRLGRWDTLRASKEGIAIVKKI